MIGATVARGGACVLAAVVLGLSAATAGGQTQTGERAQAKVTGSTFRALSPRSIGPALMSGRIGDFAVNPQNPSEFYVAVASGNLWKTTNRGVTFTPVFDSYGSYSIGCVTIDPTNPSVVWVGTGENNSQRSVGWGDGVYVTRDGGKSFVHTGLKESAHIGMIAVDPRRPDTVFAAAMGPLWSKGGDRGLYRTTDGGRSWERVLYVSEHTGVNEVHMDPRDPDVMYAAAYQRRRHVWTLVNGGPESAIYKTTDGGRSWRKVTSGLPAEDKGRIGLAVSPANPDVIYAIVEAAEGKGGIFRSTDRGETWERRNGYMTTSPQYYNELVADPNHVDRFYALDTFLHISEDGGATMRRVPHTDVHVDMHAMWINPKNSDHVLLGSDGGMYETWDRVNWRFFGNLPVTQFYRVAADNSEPFYWVYGGTQDNNTQGGPSRTTDRAGIVNEDWYIVVGGDGFEPAIDPKDPNIVYGQWQNGGLVRFDRRSGEQVDIRPREKAGDKPFVFNWDTPLVISPHKNTRLYYAANFLFRSEDRGDSWTVVSPDLTRGLDRNQMPVMDRIQKPDVPSKHASTSIYGNSVSLCESPLVEGLVYVGTDDGLVHVTEDGGVTWRRIENFPVVPELTYVSCLTASVHNADVVYAAFNNHKRGDFTPYLLRSEDRGRTWKSIAADLPARDAVHSIVEDHVRSDLLFVGTEFGAYYTLTGGEAWIRFAGLPTISVRDLEVQRAHNDLVIGTFGRGIYIVDDYSPLRHAGDLLDQPAAIFPVRPALSYVERSRLGGTLGRGWSGASYYNAKNPPFGALITYTLKEKVTSRRERRKEAEKKDDWKYPTIEEFRAEDEEQEPAVILTIRDAQEGVVRRLSVPREAGVHRVAWDLRYPRTTPATLARGELAPWETEVGGVLAPPGTYSAQLSTIIDGAWQDIGEAVAFEVRDLAQGTFSVAGAQRQEKYEFDRKAAALMRAVEGASRLIGDADQRLALLRRAAADTPGASPEVFASLESLRRRLGDMRTALQGDGTLSRRYVAQGQNIRGRVAFVVYDSAGSTQPITGTQREQFDLASAEFESLLALLAAFDADLAAFEKTMEAAGAPWTPGRLPEWKK